MSKLKGKLARRIMAIVLSGAMVMSNMSAYAAELTTETTTEAVSEVEETAAAEPSAEPAKEEAAAGSDESKAETKEAETSAVESSESTTEEEKTETTSEAKTEAVETETASESKTEAVETETASNTETETVSDTKTETVESTEEETTTEETTVEETSEEETTEEVTEEVAIEDLLREEAEAPNAKKYDFAAKQYMVDDADNAEVSFGTKFGTENYFKAVSFGEKDGQAPIIKKRGSAGKTKSLELSKWGTSGVQFTVKGTADAAFQMSSTGSSNISPMALIDADGKIVKPSSTTLTEGTKDGISAGVQEDGSIVVYGNETKASTIEYKDLAAGKYTVISPKNDKINRGGWLVGATVVETPVIVTETYDFVAKQYMVDDADNAEVSFGTKLGKDNYFRAVSLGEKDGQAPIIKKRGSAGKTKSLELSKWGTSGVQFTVKGTADAAIQVSSTGSSNISPMALIDADGNIVKPSSTTLTEGTKDGISAGVQEDGSVVVYGNETKASTIEYKGLAAGKYTVISPKNDKINRGGWLVSATVTDTFESGAGEEEAIEWSQVAAPEILSAEQVKNADGAITNNIEVKVKVVIHEVNGCEKISVEMYDSAEATEPIATVESATETETDTTVKFSPSASGTYYFVAKALRTGEEAKPSARFAMTTPFDLPLKTPTMSSVTNLGGGSVEVDWNPVPEATGYTARVYSDSECKNFVKEASTQAVFEEDGVTVKEEAATSVVIDGLTVGETYYFTAKAVKGASNISGESGSMKKLISQDKQNKWAFSAYGSSTSITSTTTDRNGNKIPKNGYSGDFYDGEVNVWSMGGAGKIVPNTIDGLAFYYTEIDPKTTNFTLQATAHVNEWVLSNGQDGFGIMASDQVGENGNGDYLWTNSYQAVVSKIEYNWDGEEVTTDTSYPKIAMKIGVGATEKVGATKEDVAQIKAGVIDKPVVWSTSQTALDTTYAKYAKSTGTVTCNMVGNAGAWDSNAKAFVENMPPTDAVGAETYVDFKLTLQKNNTGYLLSYEMPSGKVMTQQYYDTEALNHIVEDKVYVGLFASRNANVTFKDITFTTISPEDDAPAQERPTTFIALQKQVVSSTITNSSDYDFIFTSNWDGKLEVRDSKGNVVGKSDVTGSLDTEKAKLQSGNQEKDTKVHIPIEGLEVGKNVFTVTFEPSKNMKNPPEFTALKDYTPVTFEHTVEYRKYGEEGQKIYVSPDGKASGTGTKNDRLDIYTAMKYAQPGQTILLAGGTYELYKTIGTEKGVDGKPGDGYENYIKMIAEDSDQSNRPVFDFGGKYTGMTLSGNYWYFKGFDVTNSKDAQKGIQVSGKYNVLDQVNAYKNGNTGIQVSGSGNDTYDYWPQGNLILNCTSFLNADHGYEDADGFAAKLTIGSGNVFDGCIAAYNADDGWDLFAKIESGQIGSVTIKNCVAYKNGYVLVNSDGSLDLEGTQKSAGNGNGFKMGGDGLPGGSIYDDDYDAENKVYSGHKLYNSVAFANKSKGFDSNSCSNNKVYNSISFNNEGSNVALYTYSNVQTTGYKTDNVISYRTEGMGVADEISAKNQNEADYINETTYLWDTKEKTGVNSVGNKVEADWFEKTVFSGTNTVYADKNHVLLGRNSDGTINMDGFLKLTDKAGKDNVGLDGKPSTDDSTLIGGSDDTNGEISGDDIIDSGNESSGLADEIAEVSSLASEGKLGLLVTGFADEEGNGKAGLSNEYDPQMYYYTGRAVVPEDFRVYMNGSPFTDYKVSFKNNINAYVADDNRYKDIPDEKRPTMVLTLKGAYQGTYEYYFDILPVDITTEDVSVSGLSAVADGKKKAFNPTLINKVTGTKLSLNKDYVIKANKDYTAQGEYKVEINADKGTSRNYKGLIETNFSLINPMDAADISKITVKLSSSSYTYTGNAIEPEVKVSGYKAEQIDVAYINNVNEGKASIVLTGKPEEGTAGSKVLTFTIKKAVLKEANVTDANGKAYKVVDRDYTGVARIQAQPTVILKNGKDGVYELNGIRKGSKDVNKKDSNGDYLYNYTYEYKSNTEAGKASLIIKGIHNCTGSVTYRYQIKPIHPAVSVEEGLKFGNKGLEVRYSEAEYTPSGAIPNIVIKYNGNTVNKKNYSIAYKDNKKVGSATAVIKWRNSLKGTKQVTLKYKINKCNFETGNITVKSVSDVFTNGKTEIKLSALEKSNVVLTSNNTKLSKNRDYRLVYTYGEKEDPDTQESSYDPAKKSNATIKVPKTGLYVTAYAIPVGGNYELPDGMTQKEVARFRVAYYNIAQARVKAVSIQTGKTTPIYFVDGEDVGSADAGRYNRLYNQTMYKTAIANHEDVIYPYYIVVSHSKIGELEFAELRYKGDTENQKHYAYDSKATDTMTAGKQSVTFYGTGLFGGTKVYSYKLVNKVYNLKNAKIDKNISVEVEDKTDTAEVESALKKAIAGAITLSSGRKGVNPDNIIVEYPGKSNGPKATNGPLKIKITGRKVDSVKIYSGSIETTVNVTFKVKKQ